eukprot:gene25730-31070_t
MPKLYYTPTSSGAASFIAAFAAGVNLETEQMSFATYRTESGVDYYTINPKGNVPTIVLDDGTLLNETSATLLWIADQNPGSAAPERETSTWYELLAALSFVSSEFHGPIGVLHYPSSLEVEAHQRAKLQKKLEYVESTFISDKEYLLGGKFSVVDLYLYICLTWAPSLNVDLSPFPRAKAFVERIGNLPKVKEAHLRMAGKPTHVF